MVLEIAQFEITPGLEEAFEAGVRQAVPRYPGFPPRACNPQANRPCSWSRPARERRRRMTSGSNPTSTALQEP